MSRTIDYYFTLLSPWTYLGHGLFLEIAGRHGASVVYKPTPLRSVFDETGGLPLPKRHPVRQRYRMLELQRWRARRGLPLVLRPAHFPFDVSLADRMVMVLAMQGENPGAFVGDVLAGVWARDEDMSQPEVLAAAAARAGFDGQSVIDKALTPEVEDAYRARIAETVAADVFGAPSYVLDGEVFWGQDRLELLDDTLANGREPYRHDIEE